MASESLSSSLLFCDFSSGKFISTRSLFKNSDWTSSLSYCFISAISFLIPRRRGYPGLIASEKSFVNLSETSNCFLSRLYNYSPISSIFCNLFRSSFSFSFGYSFFYFPYMTFEVYQLNCYSISSGVFGSIGPFLLISYSVLTHLFCYKLL